MCSCLMISLYELAYCGLYTVQLPNRSGTRRRHQTHTFLVITFVDGQTDTQTTDTLAFKSRYMKALILGFKTFKSLDIKDLCAFVFDVRPKYQRFIMEESQTKKCPKKGKKSKRGRGISAEDQKLQNSKFGLFGKRGGESEFSGFSQM